MSLITLDQWNAINYGGKFNINTLRSWARNGKITPAPQKIGRDWLVEQCAKYAPPKKPIVIPANVDTSIEITDPVVISILRQ